MTDVARRTVTLAVHRDDLAVIAGVLAKQDGLALHPRRGGAGDSTAESRRWRTVADRFGALRRRLEGLAARLDLSFEEYAGTDQAATEDPQLPDEFDALEERVADWRRRHDALEHARDRLARQERSLQRLVGLSWPRRTPPAAPPLHVAVGEVDPQVWAQASAPRLTTPLVVVPLGGGEPDGRPLVAAAARPDDRVVLDRFLRALGFRALDLPDPSDRDIADQLRDVQSALDRVRGDLRDLRAARDRLLAEHAARLAWAVRRYAAEEDMARLIVEYAEFDDLVLFGGEIATPHDRDLVRRVHAVARQEHVVVLGLADGAAPDARAQEGS